MEQHFYYEMKMEDIVKDEKKCPLPISVIPNYMGINLCSVSGISWVRQKDKQLKTLTIHFIPHVCPEKEKCWQCDPTPQKK